MFYIANTPLWMRMLFPPGVVWNGDSSDNKVYLTFDDGPTPAITNFVMEQLALYNFKATFFCIGDNVKKHPELFEKLKKAGHGIGNHTMHHPNGWQTGATDYIIEIFEANELIGAKLFRPPYGKITAKQAALLTGKMQLTKSSSNSDKSASRTGFKIIMWSVITGDFDTKVDGETCFKRVVKYTRPGGIIVFHDSEKAFPRLEIALPKTLKWIKEQGLQPALLV